MANGNKLFLSVPIMQTDLNFGIELTHNSGIVDGIIEKDLQYFISNITYI